MNFKFTLPLLAVIILISVGATAQTVTFTNQAAELGATSGSSYRDCVVDMNGDFLDDVVRVTSNGIYIDYQLSEGGYTQTFFPMSINNPPTWSINAGDIDGNGYNDLLFGNGSQVSFVYANSDGTAYNEVGFPEYIFSQRGTFADIDNDGHLDAFVCHDVDLSHPYRNDGDGNLELDYSLIETIDAGGNYAAVWCDYDNDGDIDLYITKCRGGAPYGDPQRVNGLYRNNGDGTFTEVGALANMDDSNQGWTTIFEDFDNDGLFDAFTVNHSSGDVPGGAKNVLMRNNGDGTFTDIIDGSGIDVTDLGAWNCDAGDFNNDGYVDIFSELNQELYLNNGDGTFTGVDLPFSSGGIGDLNGDGFLDVVRGNNLWLNNGNDNNYVIFSLGGIFSNINGIGARVEIHGDWGIQIREVRSGTSFSPMKSLNAHFGLGTATAIDSVVVKWPSGVHTTIADPEINTTNHIPEAECILATTPVEIEGGMNQICSGQTVTLIAADGFETYNWSNGSSGQSIEVSQGGIYTATLTDEDGCVSVSEQVTIEMLPEDEIVLTALGETQFCEGESVVIEASYGSDFEWNNGETTQSIEVSEEGIYYTEAIGACGETVSDTILIEVLPAPAPVLADVEINEPGTVTLTAEGDNIFWYDEEGATEPVETGNEFETPVISTFTQYWAEEHHVYGGQMEVGGKPDNSGGGGIPSVGAYSYFNVWEPFTLLDVVVYVPESAGPGVRTVQLVDGSENILESTTFDLEVGEQVILLNFEVPVGEGMTLRCPENNLFRNSDGVNYPYAIGSVGELYDSFYGLSYYYYFYDWNIQREEQVCISERSVVNILITGIESNILNGTLEVFPNPSQGHLNIELKLSNYSDVQFELTDISGKVIWRMSQSNQQNIRESLDLSGYAPGVYFLHTVVDEDTDTRKIVIQ